MTPRGPEHKLLTLRADHSKWVRQVRAGDMVNKDLLKPPARSQQHRTFGAIFALVVVILIAAAVVLLVIKIKYVDCFNKPLPLGTHIGHFERCVLGIEVQINFGCPMNITVTDIDMFSTQFTRELQVECAMEPITTSGASLAKTLFIIKDFPLGCL